MANNIKYAGEGQHGKIFESDMLTEARKVLKEGNLIIYTNTPKDEKEGADGAFIEKITTYLYNDEKEIKQKTYDLEIRIDPTLNFDMKKHMPFVYETDIPCTQYQDFKIGIRVGNVHKDENTGKKVYHDFERPVVVIGANVDAKEFNEQYDIIKENLEEYMPDLIIESIDATLDFVTKNPKAREDLAQEPLKSNPNYYMHKHCEKYKELIELRSKLDKGDTEVYNQYENDTSQIDDYFKQI